MYDDLSEYDNLNIQKRIATAKIKAAQEMIVQPSLHVTV